MKRDIGKWDISKCLRDISIIWETGHYILWDPATYPLEFVLWDRSMYLEIEVQPINLAFESH